MTLADAVPAVDSSLPRAGLSIFDVRRLTTPYPVTPLLVLMGLNACLLMGGALMGLQIVGVQNSYHAALAVLAAAVVQQVQLGFGFDFPVAVAANRGDPWRFLMAGALVFAMFAALLGTAGLESNTVILYFGILLVISISGALTSTQHGALAQYYPAEVRTRAILAHQVAGVCAIALAAPVAFAFGTVLGWQAPFFALAGLAVLLAVIGGLVLPFRREPPMGEVRTLGADQAAESLPTLPEATRVLFSVPSVKALYGALPFLSVAFLGIAFYTNLLYLNVFHQNGASRRMALDVSSAGAALGALAAAFVLPRLLRSNPTRAMNRVTGGAAVAFAAVVVLAVSPVLLLSAAANIVFMAAAAWVVSGVYGVLSVALPTRLMTLGYAMSTLWFLLGVLLVGPVGTIGSTLAAGIGVDFGYQASFWLFAPLILIGTVVLHRSGRYLTADIERLHASVKADIEVRRDRAEGGGKLLVARGVEAGYDNVPVLFGIDFDIDDGEMVAVLGTNGAGKSTLAKALCGLLVTTSGEVLFDGRPITTLDPNLIVKMGIVMVPGDRGIFPGITTSENLRLAAWLYHKDDAYVREATRSVLEYFPALEATSRRSCGEPFGWRAADAEPRHGVRCPASSAHHRRAVVGARPHGHRVPARNREGDQRARNGGHLGRTVGEAGPADDLAGDLHGKGRGGLPGTDLGADGARGDGAFSASRRGPPAPRRWLRYHRGVAGGPGHLCRDRTQRWAPPRARHHRRREDRGGPLG